MWWPLSARLAMALIRQGCRVVAVCPPGHPLRSISGVKQLYPYRGLDSLGSLEAAIVDARPDILVPCDDGVVWQLHNLHETSPELRPLIERSLGPAEMYPEIRSRAGLLQLAAELGIRTPGIRTLATEQDLASWRPAGGVLKLDGTWGGTGVEIARTAEEARTAFRKLAKPKGASLAWKRLVINRDPIALWWWRKHESPNVTIQEFIPGRPANTMFVCWQGEVLGIVTVEVMYSQGATGAATVVRVIQNAEIAQAARRLAQRLKLSGFHGLDFILESGSKAPFLIELNPRCTQLGHFNLANRGDLAGALVAKLTDRKPGQASDPIEGDTIAFFPQAMRQNPDNRYLHRGYHDVPWEEPDLFRLLLRMPWPDRQLAARLYHLFRSPKPVKEKSFESDALQEGYAAEEGPGDEMTSQTVFARAHLP
jgi:hypothetical protein